MSIPISIGDYLTEQNFDSSFYVGAKNNGTCNIKAKYRHGLPD